MQGGDSVRRTSRSLFALVAIVGLVGLAAWPYAVTRGRFIADSFASFHHVYHDPSGIGGLLYVYWPLLIFALFVGYGGSRLATRVSRPLHLVLYFSMCLGSILLGLLAIWLEANHHLQVR